jgi:hypothetical protein
MTHTIEERFAINTFSFSIMTFAGRHLKLTIYKSIKEKEIIKN